MYVFVYERDKRIKKLFIWIQYNDLWSDMNRQADSELICSNWSSTCISVSSKEITFLPLSGFIYFAQLLLDSKWTAHVCVYPFV